MEERFLVASCKLAHETTVFCVLRLRSQATQHRADRSRRIQSLREQLSALEDEASQAKYEVCEI